MASGTGIQPTRLTAGLSTVTNIKPLGDFPHPSPFHTSGSAANVFNQSATMGVCKYDTDFVHTSDLSDFTSGYASAALSTTLVGGVAVYTPTSATLGIAYKTGQYMQFVAGQKLWFQCNVALSTLAGVGRYGLQAGAVSTVASLMFVTAVTSGIVSLVSIVNSTTTVLIANVGTMVAATPIDLAYYYDGTDLLVYVANALVTRVAAPTIGATGTTLTNAILTPAFQSTPAATETTSVDWLLGACEIAR